MEMILTPEEEAASSWLDWDNEAIGQAVRGCAQIAIGEEPNRILQHSSAALLLCCAAHEVNAETFRQTINGVTFSGKPIGHYRITVERSDEPFTDPPVGATYDGDRLTNVVFGIDSGTVTAPRLRDERSAWTKLMTTLRNCRRKRP